MMLKAKVLDRKKLKKKHPELTDSNIDSLTSGTTYTLSGVAAPQEVVHPMSDLADRVVRDSEMPVYLYVVAAGDTFVRLTYDGN